MKTSALFSLALATTGVVADPVQVEPPTKVARDLASVTSVVAQVSAAITQLDTTVKSFSGSDITKLQTDADALITSLKSGVSALAGGSLSLTDTLGLQDVIKPLGPAAADLVKDLSSKKGEFEKAALCGTVGDAVKDVGTEAQSMVDGVVKQVPEALRGIATSLSGDIVDTLTKLATEFTAENCKDAVVASSSAVAVTAVETSAKAVETSATAVASSYANSSSAAVEVPTNVVENPAVTASAVTVTVTAPCECSSTAALTTTSTSTSAIPVITPPVSSVGTNSTFIPTGALPATSATQSIVTAGAVPQGAGSGSIGFLAAFAALLFV